MCIAISINVIIIDPRGRPIVMAGSDHCFAHVVRQNTFQNKPNIMRKQCSLLKRLWVWPSGSLMTPVFFLLLFFVLNPCCQFVSFLLVVFFSIQQHHLFAKRQIRGNLRIVAVNKNENTHSYLYL